MLLPRATLLCLHILRNAASGGHSKSYLSSIVSYSSMHRHALPRIRAPSQSAQHVPVPIHVRPPNTVFFFIVFIYRRGGLTFSGRARTAGALLPSSDRPGSGYGSRSLLLVLKLDCTGGCFSFSASACTWPLWPWFPFPLIASGRAKSALV